MKHTNSSDSTFQLALTKASLDYLQRLLAEGGQEVVREVGEELTELVAQRFASIRSDNRLVLDVTVASLVAVPFYAQIQLEVITTRENASSIDRRVIYYHDPLIVEYEQRDEWCTIMAIRDLDVLQKRLRRLLALTNQPAPAAAELNIPAAVFEELPFIVAGSGWEAGVTKLEEAGVASENANNLVNALAYPVRQSALHFCRKGTKAEEQDYWLRFVETLQGLWLFRSVSHEGQLWIHALPCDAAYVIRQIMQLVANRPPA